MPDMSKASAAAMFSRHWFGFDTEQRETVVTVLAASPTQLAKHDPDRLALFMVLQGATKVNVTRDRNPTTATGLPMPTQYDALLWKPETDGVATTYERWGLATTADSNVLVIETRRVRRPAAVEGS